MPEAVPGWMRAAFGLTGRVAPRLAARLAAELLTRPRGRNPAQPWELAASPLEAREIRLGGDLYARSWGMTGPVVLAQHGWRGRPTQFVRLAESLVPAGYRVVALDAPGHGRSAGRRATPRRVADHLVAAARELGDVRAVVGHSLGGAAAALALEFGLEARRLVMIASPARPSRMIADYAARLGLPSTARVTLDSWFDAHAGRPVGQLDPAALSPPAGVETLVVHDLDDDIILVGNAELLQRTWPSAQFLYTRGLGHRDLLADPAVVRAVTAFVAAPTGADQVGSAG